MSTWLKVIVALLIGGGVVTYKMTYGSDGPAATYPESLAFRLAVPFSLAAIGAGLAWTFPVKRGNRSAAAATAFLYGTMIVSVFLLGSELIDTQK